MTKMIHETEFDEEKYISLKGLINHHNGEYKSAKQGRYFKRTSKACGFENNGAYRFLDYDISDDEFLFRTSAHINYDPSKTGIHRGYRLFSFIFILDNYGINKLFKVTHGFEKTDNDTVRLPPRKQELIWEREEIKHDNNIAEDTQEDAESCHVGNIGDKVEKELTLDFRTTFTTESYNGGVEYKSLFKFKDNDGNIYAWFTTATRDWEVGDKFKAKFTVKDHDIYKGDSQTVVKRLNKVN